jgi:predicted ATPase/DNA-binding SARP family transcriptional activator
MEFSVLGPFEVRAAGGRAVALGGVKPRALLAVLAMHANESVSAEPLAHALWGEDAPASAVKTVQVHVSRLRRALGDPELLVTTPAGYRLRVLPGELDAERFERLVADGRTRLAAGDAERAAATLSEALGLWRGPPLADLAALPFATAEIARLEEQRLAALELRAEADLAAGRHAELVPELERLTREQPWRERLHAQLMLALYRSGRQADALEAYRRAREVLVEELGIEPGVELAELQRAILAHDPGLRPPTGRRSRAGSELDAGRDSTLPVPPNRTIGRDDEIAAVAAQLGAVRLLTLTGPGGVGKTRLAVQVARAAETAFGDGARFVALAPLRRPGDVPGAIQAALGVVVVAGETPAQAIARFLAAKQLLLVLDNCEHVLDGLALVARLLETCPHLTVLATSREPLGLQAEQRHAVPPLAGTSAAALFAARARGHDGQFVLDEGNAADVDDICRRLDRLPLAIELAAARCTLLSPREIAERLDEALSAGARDVPARQRTLRATIDWSHALLDDDEKACFARFAAFVGGATVEAAEAVTGASLDVLERLVAKSLLVRRTRPSGHTRLLMLETIRAYAAERLAAASDAEAVREGHYRHFLAYARHHGGMRTLSRADGPAHVASLDSEADNLRAALEWACAQDDAEAALSVTATLAWWWAITSRYPEALDWIDRALALPSADAHPALVVETLRERLWSLWAVGRAADQPAVAAEIESIARRTGDPLIIAHALGTCADYASGLGRIDLAASLSEEALDWARRTGDEWEIASALRSCARGAVEMGELRERVDLAAGHLERVGNVRDMADLLTSAAYSALCGGADADATDYAERAITSVRATGDPFMWMILTGNRGLAALFTGDHETARAAFREELEIARELVVRPIASEGLLGLAGLTAGAGDLRRAARLRGASEANMYDQPQDEILARVEATFLRPARERLGAAEWDAAVRQGAALDYQDAIAYALEETPVPVDA